MKKVKQWDYSRIYLNPCKLVYQRTIDFGYGYKHAQDQAQFVKNCLGCCIFKNHEIALNLKHIEMDLDYYKAKGVCNNIQELICLVLSHEVMELLCNDEMHNGMLWHYFSDKLRNEGYKV